MADGVKISSLVEATDAQMTDAGLIEAAVADTGSSTGFSSKKASLSRFAGYILNKFSGLSLAGSTQTVKSALDSLNSNLFHLDRGIAIPSGADLDSYITAGTYYCGSASIAASLVHCPVSTVGFKFTVSDTGYSDNYKIQNIKVYNRTDGERIITRCMVSNNPVTFTDWFIQPLRSEIGSLSSLTTTAKTNLVAAVNEVNTAINSLVDGNEVSY